MWLLNKLLSRVVRRGELTIIDAKGKVYKYGSPDDTLKSVTVRFNDNGVAFKVASDPGLGAGEAYMNQRFDLVEGSIADMIELFYGNSPWDESGPSRDGFGERFSSLHARIDRLNWESRSKKNVAHHYDLNDRLYDLFLDCDRQYSCAYFTDPANALEQAQSDKKAHIAAKLALKPGQRVLDIGCGWGGMALYLHEKSGVDVLGITLSEEQLKVARARAQAAGAGDHVKFELIDYRAVEGPFDRIVSVGMFEHVGPPFYRTFFRKCRELLTDDGVMLLHTIGRMCGPGTTDRWTTKYIFPGGYSPALSEIARASEAEKMITTDVETLRLHYAHTLDEWYRRCVAAHDEIVKLYDERFYRMWTFYLTAAASSFRHGTMCNYQLQYVKRRKALPITRDYIGTDERALNGATLKR
jgi:cyclopropane-fatty-acyl-phospholipid synthase